ncbi:hypothetical protein C9374_000975 [Naegleria lovaniensis]|uniref:Uncharacterized protein n=1 Tax=Naegleria lovaniensis TaxID=51637 RepID=A0AA88GW86_NAELO|nr:uncharacterized protein C9374_000975 [Naegleria lovaniensis]KAG2388125.1 hypothetical protein C9374_000975 [Naegleria lovaniensis]
MVKNKVIMDEDEEEDVQEETSSIAEISNKENEKEESETDEDEEESDNDDDDEEDEDDEDNKSGVTTPLNILDDNESIASSAQQSSTTLQEGENFLPTNIDEAVLMASNTIINTDNLQFKKPARKRKDKADEAIKKVLKRVESASMSGDGKKKKKRSHKHTTNEYKPYTSNHVPIVRSISSANGSYLVIPNDVKNISEFLFTRPTKKTKN